MVYLMNVRKPQAQLVVVDLVTGARLERQRASQGCQTLDILQLGQILSEKSNNFVGGDDALAGLEADQLDGQVVLE